MTNQQTTKREPLLVGALKARAREMRAEAAARGQTLSHSAALEAVAHRFRLRDWNTLSALAHRQAEQPFQSGDRVAGRYLGHAFDGRIVSATEPQQSGEQRVTVDFDEPIDVVQFESFSALRKRVSADIRGDGETAERVSDGTPHMQLYRPFVGLAAP